MNLTINLFLDRHKIFRNEYFSIGSFLCDISLFLEQDIIKRQDIINLKYRFQNFKLIWCDRKFFLTELVEKICDRTKFDSDWYIR